MRRTVLTLACLLCLAPSAHAANWSEINSGTTAEITAIEFQGDGRFWYTTANGEIFKRNPDGTFTRKFGPTSIRLNDIEFQSGGGGIGFAAGAGGQVLRSVDNGDNWTSVNTGGSPIPVSKKGTTFPDCRATEPLGEVFSVRFAGNSRVWIFAEGSQLATSQPGTPANVGALGTWVDANRDTKGTPSADDDTCRIRGDIYGDGHSDGFFSPTNPDVGHIVAASFAAVFFTSNNLAGDAIRRPAEAGNAGLGRRKLVGDPDNTSRMWSVAPAPYGRSTTGYTDDAYATLKTWVIGNDSKREFSANGPYDVDFAGGTVLAAGDAGMILNSTDGANFFYTDATGSLATQAWRAVSLASATQGAVGGTGGKLIVTSDSNVIPDITAPTVSIQGPATGKTGTPVTFTAQAADNAGGSGVDPNSFVWKVTGFPDQTGPNATYNFTSTGSYTVRLTVRDLAGNTSSQANHFISITQGTPPAPAFDVPSSGVTAKIVGGFVRVTIKGSITPPAGIDRAQACKGTVVMSIKKVKGKGQYVGQRNTKLKSDCSFRKVIRIRRSKLKGARRIKVTARFVKNAVLSSKSKTFIVKVKK